MKERSMVALDSPRSAPRTEQPREGRRPQAVPGQEAPVNVAMAERAVSFASGAMLAIFGLKRRSIGGLIIAGLGGALVKRGVTGHLRLVPIARHRYRA